MSDKKKSDDRDVFDKALDDRDVFDKALDYAVPVGAAAVGAIAGSKGLRFLRRQVKRPYSRAELEQLNRDARKAHAEFELADLAGNDKAALDASTRKLEAWEKLNKAKADGFKQALTGVAGGVGGAGVGYHYGSDIRRRKKK